MQDYHRLKVWEKSHALAIDVHRLAGTFPRVEGVALTGQLRRAALSIPANIAEGAGKPGNAEFRRFLNIALGSASETHYHLLVARDLGLIEPSSYEDLAVRTTEVRRMLTGLLKKVTATTGAASAASRDAASAGAAGTECMPSGTLPPTTEHGQLPQQRRP